jgi:hypothetical protein
MRKKVVIQDDSREILICNHLGLQRQDELPACLRHGKKREGIDAMSQCGAPFEIKGGTKDSGISTARDVSPKKIAQWRKCYWVFSRFSSYEGDSGPLKLYVCHPDHLEPFFEERERRYSENEDRLERLLDKYQINDPIDRTFFKSSCSKGFKENDPKIPWGLIHSGTRLDKDDSNIAREQLSQFMIKYPIDKSFYIKKPRIDCFD